MSKLISAVFVFSQNINRGNPEELEIRVEASDDKVTPPYLTIHTEQWSVNKITDLVPMIERVQSVINT